MSEDICSVCNKSIAQSRYGRHADDSIVCYPCCAEEDRALLREGKEPVLYLSKNKDGKWQVTNWPGSLVITPNHVSTSDAHAFGRKISRHDIWFTFEGREWHGVNKGDSQIVRCHRLKGSHK